MKRPFESITESISENLEQIRENQTNNFAQVQDFSVWLVALATGAIGFGIMKDTTFSEHFTRSTLKIIMSFFCATVIFGIIFRWCLTLYQRYAQDAYFYLKSAFSRNSMMETETNNIDDLEDIDEILRRLNSDFGEDINKYINNYNAADDTQRPLIKNGLKLYYIRLAYWAKKDHDNAMKYVEDVFKKAWGMSTERFVRASNSSTNRLRLFYILSNLSFILCSLSFLGGLIIAVCNY